MVRSVGEIFLLDTHRFRHSDGLSSYRQTDYALLGKMESLIGAERTARVITKLLNVQAAQDIILQYIGSDVVQAKTTSVGFDCLVM